MIIDSGADVNTLSESDWLQVLESHLENNVKLTNLKWGNGKRTLSAYATETALVVEATFTTTVRITGTDKSVSAQFFAIRHAKKSLLGRETASALGVLRLGLELNVCETILHKTDTDEIFPTIPDELVHFDIDHTVQPTKNAYFNVPAAFRQRARERLTEMSRQGIIEEVLEAPRWISGMSLVPKGKADFRLVVNMRGPNRAIKRAFHRLPTIDDMKVKLAGATLFTKLDIKSAFYHLELDEESRQLTTFQTETGMRRFTRLMFGVNCAPEIFQRTMERKLTNIEGVIIFIDDVLIFAPNALDLRTQTAQVTKRLKENNLSLNHEKCIYEQNEIQFLGHRLSKDGFAIDQAKVRDVQEFNAPGNPTDLRSFLGLASYLSDYIERFADLVSPMWDVLKGKAFEWTPDANQSFLATKNRIADCTTKLGFFSDTASTIVYADASPHALGAVLVQEEDGHSPRIICFTSKALSITEKAYPQIQKEALGIVWAVERLYYYLLGRRFTIRTDARGLSFIFDRDRTTCKRALNRAEGWALRLSGYDYAIEWIKGENNIADPSSRLTSNPTVFSGRTRTPGEIASLTSSPQEPIGALSLETIRIESRQDRELCKVKHALRSDRWTEEIRSYERVKDDLREVDGLITRTGAIVIPSKLRSKVLEIAHEGHPGQSAMKSIMRKRVWWPRMPTDTEEWVTNCRSCALTSRPEYPVPMKYSVLPDEPWDKLAIDFNGPHAACGGKSILVLVDYFSRFVIAEFVKSTDFLSVAPTLENTFNLLGNPISIRSDNGPPFNGTEWKEFCVARAIKPEFSTPGHPQQNGLVERYMQIVNKSITAAVDAGVKHEQALRASINAHNAATQRTTNTAPEVLLFGRLRRGKLPIMGKTTIAIDTPALRKRDEENKSKTRDRENEKRCAKPTRIKPGDQVFIKRHLKAKDQTRFAPEEFKIISKNHGDFTVRDSTGRTLNRNTIQLKKAPQKRSDPEPAAPISDEEPRAKRIRVAPKHLSDYIREITE